MTNTPAKKPAAAKPAAAKPAAAKPAAPRAAAKPAAKPAKPAKVAKPEPAPYIVITGNPGAVFEQKIAEALKNHYEISGAPSVGHDGKSVILAQAMTHKKGKKGKKKK